MSQDNVDVARRAFDAFNRRDLDAFLALMDEEVEVGSRQVAIEGGYHGHQVVRRWWTDLFAAFPDYTAEVQELRDLGDVMLVRVRGSAQSAHGDTLMLDRFWQVGRWRDGTCLWWRNYSSEAEAFEAVGLRE
jgi:ketosteroid isomerase-like protein